MEEDEGECRDWAEMQSDALSAVFRKLDAVDLLTGAGLVCRPWRRLADSDTTLWRRVDMTRHGDVREADAMARAAVDRAAGTLEAFSADTFVTDGLLRYISHRFDFYQKHRVTGLACKGIEGTAGAAIAGEQRLGLNLLDYFSTRAFSLKSLQLSLCNHISNEGLAEAIKRFPQLEELDITFCSLYGNICHSIGKTCPQLKCFRLKERWNEFQKRFDAAYEGIRDDTQALGIANSMPGLQDLQLIGNDLTNDGLMAILDHCPHLKSLDIRMCYNLRIDDAMKSKCARIENLKLPRDSISDFKYQACVANYYSSSDSEVDYPGSDFEVDMHDDFLDVVMDDDSADGEFDYVDDFDDAGSESAMYDDVDDI